MGERTEEAQRLLTRRQFLVSLSMLTAGGTLTACAAEEDFTLRTVVEPSATPRRVLQSPVPATPEPVATTVVGGLNLDEFLQLSSVLTGFENLDPALGRVYLESLQTRESPQITLAELYLRAGFGSGEAPQTVDDLAEAGFFDDEAARSLADTILELWYTGIYQTPEGERVATFVDALAWKAITYTHVPSTCGPQMGYWAGRPEYQVEPN